MTTLAEKIALLCPADRHRVEALVEELRAAEQARSSALPAYMPRHDHSTAAPPSPVPRRDGTGDAQPLDPARHSTGGLASLPQTFRLPNVPAGEDAGWDLAARFHELAEQWEKDAMFLSTGETDLPSHKAIVDLGEPAVSLILERMQVKGGRWYHALRDITGEDPADPADWGNVAAIQQAWLRWGRDRGLVQAGPANSEAGR